MGDVMKKVGKLSFCGGLFLFGIAKLWLPVTLIVVGIALILLSNEYNF